MSKKKIKQQQVNIYETFTADPRKYSRTVIITVVAAVLIGLVLILGITYPFVIRPYLRKQQEQPPVNTNIGEVQVESRPALTDTINEYLFRRRYVSQPTVFGDEILIGEGEDGSGNPKMKNIVLFDRNNVAPAKTISAMKLEHFNFLNPQFNDKWIVVVDAKERGGGQICLYNRESGKYTKIKEYAGAAPRIELEGDRLVWFEQLYGDLSSVYIYDIPGDHLTSVAVQEGLPFVYGGADFDGKTIVWAGLDAKDKNLEDMLISNRGAIHRFDLESKAYSVYEPGMYVYAPRVQGETVAWIDTDGKPTSTLYASIGGGAPRKIAGDVSGFDVGEGYISFCSNERIYAYFVDGNVTLEVSRPGQRCFYIGDDNGYTTWYDVTSNPHQRDVVKYIKLERDAWQS